MCYKSNYEPYTSQSLDIKRAEDLSSEELLNPLGSLYPHVVALQLQSDDTPWIRAKNSPGYRDPNSWIDVYSTEDYSKPSARRNSGELSITFDLSLRKTKTKANMTQTPQPTDSSRESADFSPEMR
ncbi:uncharacterized protein NFIA_069420 [Aspergillus fischeri NRRL 181]|uniref:Uncharacterized protein n=1 Tax=Neosartorya fischeri (strain ATCC 1020 / DSM 3700 / CBS 544.65 / FGSC A1164 / JCM 1740 / NRRL 181 / WB 181) TaxID=331117 RepID=A1D7S7_NEOFI|nr:conserved hypothetical protein [Aspergillus fischeri NRRL 181]EAW21771.1 conserved hypothetical protein [Aspergillus fischeri NRRL 181]KAG2024731.1 hypothetical protein GB937_003429 [Aspergillus fischeri]